MENEVLVHQRKSSGISNIGNLKKVQLVLISGIPKSVLDQLVIIAKT